MKKEKKTIKEEIEELISKWENENKWGGGEDADGGLTPALLDWDDAREELIALFCQTFRRFIEETKIDELEQNSTFDLRSNCDLNYCNGYNQARKRINQNQVKWLKENL